MGDVISGAAISHDSLQSLAVAEGRTPAPTVRDLRSDETDFLLRMLYAALDWRPGGNLPSLEQVVAHPQISIFHEGWGRAGDVALVAEVDGRPAGLVWYRLFTHEVHGEGFVDEETPELAIAVMEEHRGRGIGRLLMGAAHARAVRGGFPRLSLSVDPDNPARRLYESLGYRDHEPNDGSGRMILHLAMNHGGPDGATRAGIVHAWWAETE